MQKQDIYDHNYSSNPLDNNDLVYFFQIIQGNSWS